MRYAKQLCRYNFAGLIKLLTVGATLRGITAGTSVDTKKEIMPGSMRKISFLSREAVSVDVHADIFFDERTLFEVVKQAFETFEAALKDKIRPNGIFFECDGKLLEPNSLVDDIGDFEEIKVYDNACIL